MATTTTFKDVLDLPEWRPTAVSPNTFGTGQVICCDLRNNADKDPRIFALATTIALNSYSTVNDGWVFIGTPALASSFAAGTGSVFMPARGPRGTLAAGASTTKVTLSTALPAAVGINQLASRGGDGVGYKIRIIGNSAGSSGKTEERYIVANSGGTTPALILDSALSFTPAAGDAYEFLSGRVYMVTAGAAVAGMWKYYDVLTNSFSGNLSVTNLATGTVETMLNGMDELYVPCNNTPGQGFILGSGTNSALTATAAAAGTLTGQAAGGDAAVLTNEWRNFQIRITQDVTTPTAVGQRRRITSHTAGPSPVYTVTGNWTVTPSANAQYVIENNNEIIVFGNAATTVFTYAQDTYGTAQTGDTWSTTTYSARGNAVALGQLSFQAFGVSTVEVAKDVDKNFRYSQIFAFRGGAATTLDVLDISGGANGSWSAAVVYASMSGAAPASGSVGIYDPISSFGSGKFYYLNISSQQPFYRFNAFTRQMCEWTYLRYSQSTNVNGARMALGSYIDGATRLSFIYSGRASGTEMFQILVQR